MPNVINTEWDIMSNGKKRRLEIMLNILNAEWDKMLKGKKIQYHFKGAKREIFDGVFFA